jgi:rhamnosyltransferase
MRGLGAAVILYHPGLDFIDNLKSYLSRVSMVFIIDNTEEPASEFIQKLLQLSESIHYVSNRSNLGIAAALNQAAKMAVENGIEWLLTMDQDSFFSPSEGNLFFEASEEIISADASIALAAPAIDANECSDNHLKKEFVQVNAVITSGSIMRIDYWQKLGGFNESLFIDEVDHEFCYRAVLAGYNVIRFRCILMEHRMGRKQLVGYFGRFFRRQRMIHSPLRVYYMVRNYLFVRSKYCTVLPEEFHTRDKELLVILKNNLLFSGNFYATFKSILRGYRDYKKTVFGKYC